MNWHRSPGVAVAVAAATGIVVAFGVVVAPGVVVASVRKLERESRRMARGEHLFVWRRFRGIPFQHHAIDLGDGSAIHFSDPDFGIAGPGGDPGRFVILETQLAAITRGGVDRTHWVRHRGAIEADGIVDRARGQVGRRGYDLIWNNCEHFATWCCVGNRESRQVTVACERFAAAGAKVAARAAVRVAIRAGVRGIARGGSPYLVLADVAHWATEAGGHHVGLSNPRARDRAGRICGGVTALGIGAFAGPVGVGMAGGMWAAGELASRFGRRTYDGIRRHREKGLESEGSSDGLDSRASGSAVRLADPVPASETPHGDGVDRG